MSGTGLSTDKTEASRASRANANDRSCPSRCRLGVTVLMGFRRGFGGRGIGPPRRWLAARVGEVQSTSKARVVVYLISNRRLIEKNALTYTKIKNNFTKNRQKNKKIIKKMCLWRSRFRPATLQDGLCTMPPPGGSTTRHSR